MLPRQPPLPLKQPTDCLWVHLPNGGSFTPDRVPAESFSAQAQLRAWVTSGGFYAPALTLRRTHPAAFVAAGNSPASSSPGRGWGRSAGGGEAQPGLRQP